MSEPRDLDALYKEARAALVAKDFERAAGLLKRILLYDENYKDASRLLAQVVARQRRHWYKDHRIWGIFAILVIACVVFLIKDRLLEFVPSPNIHETPKPTEIADAAGIEIPTSIPTTTITSTPTAIPLSWARISIGGIFLRDAVEAIAVDPGDPEVLYVGTENAGIYKSIDGGLSWQPAQSGLQTASIVELVINPEDTQKLYASTLLGGINITRDGGNSWRTMNTGIRRFTYWSQGASTVALDPFTSNRLYYMDLEHIYEAGPGGGWNLIVDGERRTGPPGLTCEPYFQALAVHPTQRYTLIVAEAGLFDCPPGVYMVDTKSGKLTSLLRVEGSVETLGQDSLSGSYLYVSGSSGDRSVVYSSSDGGVNWTQTPNARCTSIAISPTNGAVAYCAGEYGLKETSNGGKTWRTLALPVPEHEWRSSDIHVEVDDQRLFLGMEGLYISQNGGVSWESRQNGLGGTFLQLSLRPNHPNELYLEEGSCGINEDTNLFVSRDGGVTWSLETDRGCGAAFSHDGGVIYRIDPSNPGLLRSPGGGAPWTTITLPAAFPIYLSSIPPDPGSLFVAYHDYHGDGAPVVSYDDGASWESTNLHEARLTLAYDGQAESLYAFAAEGNAFRSTDKGKTWYSCHRVDYWTSEIGSQFAAVHPRDHEHILVGTRGGGILVSTNGCNTWRPSNEGLGSLFVNVLAIDTNDPELMYAGTDSGAYVSFDGGASWSEINEGLLGATVVYSIVVDPQGNVYAATPYGIFKLEGR